MRMYPIMLDVRDRPTVVIGGGSVGLRRTRTLREAGARVTLVSMDVPDRPLPDEVQLVEGPYRTELLAGAFLVLACTDDAELNARIARDAREAGALVNVADQPEDCDFYLPAIARDGDVIVAVGTAGASPGLAGSLKKRLQAALPERIGEFAAVLFDLRAELRDVVPDIRERMRIMKELSAEKGYEAFLAGGVDAVRKLRDELAKG